MLEPATDEAPDDSVDTEAAAIERQTRLVAFAKGLVDKRDAAIEFKKQTGVEEEWNEDEDYYNGIDPYAKSADKLTKGRSTDDSLKGGERYDGGKGVGDNITEYHVDMRAARATDMLTPTDDKPFKIKPTPMPEVSKLKDDPRASAEILTNQQGQQTTVGNAIDLMQKEATESAEEAERWIWDKFIEFNWHGEFRKCIHEAHKIGNWVMKGPFPVKRKARVFNHETGAIESTETIEPASRAIDARNLFPDPACYPSEDIQKGSFVWERDEVSYRQLSDLKEMMVPSEEMDEMGQPVTSPMYLDEEIDKCLIEGPAPDVNKRSGQPYQHNEKDLFTIWYGYVTADHKDMEAAGCECGETESVPAQITMVNDRVIQATLSPLGGSEFPYDILIFARRPGTPWGKGVARKVRGPQRKINGYDRARLKNAALTAGPMMGYRRGKVFAADGGKLCVRPYLVFDTVDEETDITKVITFVETPDKQASFMQSIQYELARADLLVGNAPQDQGVQNTHDETGKGRVILQNNSNAPQRQIARNADDGVIEPHVKRYYGYWLAHVPGDKGSADHQVEALGSTSMFEQDAENQLNLQVFTSGLAMQPDARIDMNKLTKALYKGQKLNPATVQYTDDDWKRRQDAIAQQPPPVDPAIEVANIRKQSAAEVQGIRSQEAVQKVKMDTDRDTLFEQTRNELVMATQQYNERKLGMEREIALLKENGESARQIEDLKVKLADTTMKLAMQEKLAAAARKNDGNDEGLESPQVVTPPNEPPGRSPNGAAFQA